MKSPWLMSKEELIAEVIRLRRIVRTVEGQALETLIALDTPGLCDVQAIRSKLSESRKETNE